MINIYLILLPNIRVRVSNNFCVPVNLLPSGNCAIKDGLIPDLKFNRGIYTIIIIL